MILNYRKRARSETRLAAPEAAMFVAVATFGEKWTSNPALSSLPAYRRNGAYETHVFGKNGKKYRHTTKPVVVGREMKEHFRQALQMFTSARVAITEAVVEGKLRGVVEPANGTESFPLDKARSGLVGDQVQTMFMTGYVPLDSGRSYGMVVFEKDRLELFVRSGGKHGKIIKGYFSTAEVTRLDQLARDYAEDLSIRLKEADWPVITHDVLHEVRDLILDIVKPGAKARIDITERQLRLRTAEAFKAAGLFFKGGRPPTQRQTGPSDLKTFLDRKQAGANSENPSQKPRHILTA